MRNVTTIVLVCLIAALPGCHTNKDKGYDATVDKADTAVGKVEIYAAAAIASLDTNAGIRVIAKGFNWSEGPLWIGYRSALYFSDVPENKIYQWKQGDTATLYLNRSGYTGIGKPLGELGSNGLALDKNGRLILCQSGNRQVARMNASLDSPAATFTVLAAGYNGKRFNSPNDLVADKNNNIYFTDPTYGLPGGDTDTARQLPFEGVYKIDPAGKVQLLIDSIPKPNGVALSNDGGTLYIASSDDNKPRWFAYQLGKNGNIEKGGVLYDALQDKKAATIKQGPDGLKIDRMGNIFSAGPDGINVLSPAGKRLALIKVYGRKTSNCCFDETGKVLFITADDEILKVTLHQ